ncbi:MAG: EamA family transporter [Flavobacteriaceae bacterium]|nr:MAG: EamA family transporter [Flavobacteriaceae bacterium]
MKSPTAKHFLEINIAILLISTSGALGKYIHMPPPVIIWMRSILAVVFLGLYCWYKRADFNIKDSKNRKTIFLSGVFMGIHWVTYFYALHLSNVAIGMLSLFTYPVITTFLEPLFFKTKLNLRHVILGILVLIGISFLAPEFDIKNDQTLGIISGIISAFFYALRNILMKKMVSKTSGSILMFYQMMVISLFLWPVLFFLDYNVSTNDIGALITLALLTTTIGHTLFVMSFRNFNISTASIMSSIQPVYGIILAFFFLSETPNRSTIIGGSIIVLTVVLEAIYHKKRK